MASDFVQRVGIAVGAILVAQLVIRNMPGVFEPSAAPAEAPAQGRVATIESWDAGEEGRAARPDPAQSIVSGFFDILRERTGPAEAPDETGNGNGEGVGLVV